MSEKWEGGDVARETYQVIAPAYDAYVHALEYENERWTGVILAQAEKAGLEGRRLLDVGCGTGLSSIPMLDRDWEVTACDVSPSMLEKAREKVDGRAELVLADMRELPDLGEFHLVWALNDPVNYLVSEGELEATLTSMRRNLAPLGVAAIDTMTLKTVRFFGGESVVEEDGKRFVWRGSVSPEEILPGSTHEVSFEVPGEPALTHVHRFRHFTEAQVLAAIKAAGLRLAGVFGEEDGDLHVGLDEERHTQAVYFFRR